MYSDDDEYHRRPKKRKRRPNGYCEYFDRDPRNNKPCSRKEHQRGLCREHFEIIHKHLRKICYLCNEEERDKYGDLYCKPCAVKMHARPECKHEGCEEPVWSRIRKTEYCKTHDLSTKCRHKGCGKEATRERFGFWYCWDHYPERKVCKYVHTGRRCRAKWYSDTKDYGDYGFCYRCNLSGIDRVCTNSVSNKKKRYSGRCCNIVDKDKIRKPCTNSTGGAQDYCSKCRKRIEKEKLANPLNL